MKPTLEWMEKAFNYYNAKYFKGELPIPKFSLGCPDGMWGAYDLRANYNKLTREITNIPNNGVLMLTAKYSRTPKDVCGTLLHEMIHEYIYLVKRTYPINVHGREFMQWANYINQDGFNICAENEITDTDVYNEGDDDEQDNEIQSSLLALVEYEGNTDYKFWCGHASVDTMDYFIQGAKRAKAAGAINIKFLECNSYGLEQTPIDYKTFTGWMGRDLPSLSSYMGQVLNDSPRVFNFSKMKVVKSVNL